MFEVRKYKKSSSLGLFSSGVIVQRVCRTCQLVKLIEDFPKKTEGGNRPDCYSCNRKKHAEYVKKIKDKKTVHRQRHRARLQGLPDNYTEENFLELKEFANGKCMISSIECDSLQIEHVQAVSKGVLGSTKGNIILVCHDVNTRKRDKSLFEFLESPLSEGLIDEDQLKETIKYLARMNSMSPTQYLEFLSGCEELAKRMKEYERHVLKG